MLRYSGILFVKCHNRVKDEMFLYKKVETNRRCAVVFFSHRIKEVKCKTITNSNQKQNIFCVAPFKLVLVSGTTAVFMYIKTLRHVVDMILEMIVAQFKYCFSILLYIMLW